MQPRDMQQDCVEDLVDASAINSQMMTETNRVETAALNLSGGLVGAKKRKAIRVIKHQMVSTKLESETEERNEMNITNGNVSLDTGVSSDLSESRPSLGSDRCGELSDGGSESGVDLCALKKAATAHSDSESRHSSGKKNNRKRCAQQAEDDDEDEDDEDDERHAKKRSLLADIKCPQCGDEFGCHSHLAHHLEKVHNLSEETTLSSLYRSSSSGSHPLWNASSKDLADIPSILHLAQASTLLSSSKTSMHDDVRDMMQDEYKNEEDDPFSAVLREMKLKGEFPCRLCDAVFPNLRALKGHNRNHLTCAPYCCNMCPKTSNDKGALIRHMRTHNGERPYECRECQYAFTTKANCERHLRNRHGKMSREELRASIIYHLNEDSSVNKPVEDLAKAVPPIFRNTMVDLTRNLLLDLQHDTGTRHSFSPRESNLSSERHDERHDQAMDAEEEDGDDGSLDDRSDDEEMEQDGPLDLTVDVLDLRKRREETNGLSLAGTKPVFVPPYFGAPYTGSSLSSLPFFYPGLSGASYTNFLESKLAEMGNPAVDLSALAVAAAHHDAIRQAQAQSKMNANLHEGLLIPAKNLTEERKLSNSGFSVGKNEAKKLTGSPAAAGAACPPSAVGFGSDAVKMVLKNGVLVKKQKQRRYRTERPFGCEHCTARFTLRSNMERHIKQQHPDVWSTRPRGHRRSTCNMSMKSLPTVSDAKSKEGKTAISPEVRSAIALQLKLKRGGDKNHSETGHSDEEGDGNLVIDEPKESSSSVAVTGESRETADLASVSKLLNNAVAQTFQQYFQPNQEEVKASASEAGTDEPDDAECTSSDGHSGSDYGHSAEGQVMKKKSAYSNAPHRVSCPYCTRKFPWTSSLRRHILTHTGQKPYKCPQCPLWFTTKSNCDRHLLRKHGNNNDSSNSRNVPDRPFKCALCPSSTFATSDNLKKHVDNKHCPGHSSTESHGQSGSEDETATKPSAAASPVPMDGEVSCDLPFKCHLCEEGYAERADVLNHLQRHHPDEFQLIVAKRALDHSNLGQTSDEGEDYDNARGKFPDYLNRKVTCAFCLRRFWSAEDLRRHMRTHTGERPFECDVCGRRFTLKHSMLRHKRKHEIKNGTEESDDDDSASGSESHVAESHPAKVRVQALWSGSDVEDKGKMMKMRACGSDLIGNLLGIPDTSLVEQLMSKPADDAARLLGVTGNRV